MEAEGLCGFEEGREIELSSLLMLKLSSRQAALWPRRESMPEARACRALSTEGRTSTLTFFVVLL
jgi:hypothetical protein